MQKFLDVPATTWREHGEYLRMLEQSLDAQSGVSADHLPAWRQRLRMVATACDRIARMLDGSGVAAPGLGPAGDILARLREAGWMVACHNDYRQAGERLTFWLLTHASGRWVKGEGATDAEALSKAEADAVCWLGTKG